MFHLENGPVAAGGGEMVRESCQKGVSIWCVNRVCLHGMLIGCAESEGEYVCRVS